MKWTTQRPTESGYYWALVTDALWNRGPIVLLVDIETGAVSDPSRYYADVSVSEPNGDFDRTIEAYEEEVFKIEAWSDEPIVPPEPQEHSCNAPHA